MNKLPFELYKYHKCRTKVSWKHKGMKFTEEDFKKEWQGAINQLNNRKVDWYLKTRDCLSSREFLKQKIYDKAD